MQILLVDDHKLFLDGFCLLLEKLADDVTISACDAGKAALGKLGDGIDFDLIILDLSIPDMDGITLLNQIRLKKVMSPVVFVSASENINQIARAIDAGASGFIPKQYDTDNLLLALSQILAGDFFVPQELHDRLEAELKVIHKQTSSLTALTKRQRDVLQLMSNGLSNKDIAESLSISEPTVKSHISVIFQTLQVSNRIECIREAEKLGLI